MAVMSRCRLRCDASNASADTHHTHSDADDRPELWRHQAVSDGPSSGLASPSVCARLVKILERPVGQQFVHFQGLLEFGIAVGYVFRPGAQFVACNSPLSRLEPAVRTPGRPVARHPQPRGRKPTLRREVPWILYGFQGRLSC